MSRHIIANKTTLNEEEKQLRNTSTGKIIFTRGRGRMCAFLIQDGCLRAVQVLEETPSKIGAVYIGKVKNVVKNINACFVEIADGELCFLSLKGISSAFLLNRTFDGRILEGDELVVQVTRDAQKTKQASVTAKLSFPDKEKLLQTALHRTCFTCLKEAPAGFAAVLERLVSKEEYEEILTDDAALFLQLQKYCETALPDKKVRFYEDSALSLNKLYALETKLDCALNERVWLKSGGYLIIEPTEALTVIDVNSGKYEAKKNTGETAFRVNCEAAGEVALQLRLRNLSGIIIVDFINMDSRTQEEQLLELLRDAVRTDKQKPLVVDMTPLGLVEITRKKSDKPLREQFQSRKKE